MSAESTQANAYLRTKVLTASPEQLRMMLLDGAAKFARQARDGLESGDLEAAHNGFCSCRDIITELITSMRPEIDPELCNRLSGLYTFMYTQLIEASHERDIAKVDKVIELIDYERQTWSMLIERVASERSAAPPGAGTENGGADGYQPLSVEG